MLPGGEARIRTGGKGFAGLCLTTWPLRRKRTVKNGPEMQWSGQRGSNPRPQPWQGCALPTEPLPRAQADTIKEGCGQCKKKFEKTGVRIDPGPGRCMRAAKKLKKGACANLWMLYSISSPMNGRWAVSSGGEHYLDTVGVTGSIPVSPTIEFSESPLRLSFCMSGGGPQRRPPERESW